MPQAKIFVSNDLGTKEPLDGVDWSRAQNKNYSALHGVASYLAMFCPALPDYFIKEYSQKEDLVMDNFSGRGTTALVARERRRRFVGSDLNPYAYVLTRFKISHLVKAELLATLAQLRREFEQSKYHNLSLKHQPQLQELRVFYHETTLRQLVFLRETYGRHWRRLNPTANAILALALGLMHGPQRRNNSSIYFSLSMPNTISMAPNYVNNYARRHGLTPPEVNIFDLITERLNQKYDATLLEVPFEGQIYFHDATQINNAIADNSVKLVVTSPPYLAIVNYTSSNWLKLWLLGYDRKALKQEIRLSDNLKLAPYIDFIKNYLEAIYPKLQPNAKVCLVVGDVFDRALIEEVWNQIKNQVQYRFVRIYYDYKYKYHQTHKTTHMLKSKSGRATKIDKVLVIEKNEN